MPMIDKIMMPVCVYLVTIFNCLLFYMVFEVKMWAWLLLLPATLTINLTGFIITIKYWNEK